MELVAGMGDEVSIDDYDSTYDDDDEWSNGNGNGDSNRDGDHDRSVDAVIPPVKQAAVAKRKYSRLGISRVANSIQNPKSKRRVDCYSTHTGQVRGEGVGSDRIG